MTGVKLCCDLAHRCLKAIKNPARGGASEYSVGRSIAIHNATFFLFTSYIISNAASELNVLVSNPQTRNELSSVVTLTARTEFPG